MELNTKEDLLNVISELIENDKAREAKLQTIEETVSSIGSKGDTQDNEDSKDNEESTNNEENLTDEEVDELTQLLMTD